MARYGRWSHVCGKANGDIHYKSDDGRSLSYGYYDNSRKALIYKKAYVEIDGEMKYFENRRKARDYAREFMRKN